LLLALLLWAALPARAGTEPLSLIEIPAGSSFFSASVTNTFDGIGTGAADDWTLEAEGGDRLTARIEATVGNSRPRLRLLNPSGQTIATVDGGTTGVAEFYNVLLPVPGAYRVRVYTDNQVSDYRLRVDVGRGAALEAEPNDSTNTANVVPPIFLAGSFRFRIGATLPGTDSAGDFFSLGTLDTGNTLAADLVTGPYSTLQPGMPCWTCSVWGNQRGVHGQHQLLVPHPAAGGLCGPDHQQRQPRPLCPIFSYPDLDG
jgi:hypothetical protein